MPTKAPNPAGLLADKDVSPIIEAYFELNHLKQIYRQGWLDHGIETRHCESVAEHSFGVATLALFVANACFPQLDLGKVVRMALLHDIGEVYVGDIVHGPDVDAAAKRKAEDQAIVRILEKLPKGDEYIADWRDFEHGASPEAVFIRQMDRLEMACQASVYEHQQVADLANFFSFVSGTLLSCPEDFKADLESIFRELEELRIQ